jgi:cobalt-precorrin 5A hydrolase
MIENNSISIICPSPKGKEIAKKLQEHLNGELCIKDDNFNLSAVTSKAMGSSKGIIFISSTGIAVRAIAPYLKGKDKDPGVVVVDLSGKYAINILSGHLGGGNELAIKVSEILNNMPVITTASDNLGITAPDILAKENNLIIKDLKKAKYIAALLIAGKIVAVKDDYNTLEISKGYEKVEELKEDCIWITNKLKLSDHKKSNNINYSKILKLIKKDIVLGIGCRKGTPYELINDFVRDTLEKNNIDIKAVNSVVSVDIKKNEEGIVRFADSINCPFKTYKREDIKTVQDKYSKSEFVLKTLGVTSVCEPCVDLAGAKVIVNKIKSNGMTLAIGIL